MAMAAHVMIIVKTAFEGELQGVCPYKIALVLSFTHPALEDFCYHLSLIDPLGRGQIQESHIHPAGIDHIP